jgi:hypothetical protein
MAPIPLSQRNQPARPRGVATPLPNGTSVDILNWL